MANVSQKQDLQNAIFTDINPLYGVDNLPLVLADEASVQKCSLFALLNCPWGDRGGLFEPTYGTGLPWFIQEPIDEITAQQIQMSLYDTFSQWEPRIEINSVQVEPRYTLPGYQVTVSATYKITKQQLVQSYLLRI